MCICMVPARHMSVAELHLANKIGRGTVAPECIEGVCRYGDHYLKEGKQTLGPATSLLECVQACSGMGLQILSCV